MKMDGSVETSEGETRRIVAASLAAADPLCNRLVPGFGGMGDHFHAEDFRGCPDLPSADSFVCGIDVLSSWIRRARTGHSCHRSVDSSPGILAHAALLHTAGLRYEVPKFLVFFFTGAFISWLARRQRRDEEALLRAREGLEEKVLERTADLQWPMRS